MDYSLLGTASKNKSVINDKENSPASKRQRSDRMGHRVLDNNDDSNVLKQFGLGVKDSDNSSSCDVPPSTYPSDNSLSNADFMHFFELYADRTDDTFTDISENSAMSTEQMQRSAKLTPSLAKFVTNSNHQQIIRSRNPLTTVVGNASQTNATVTASCGNIVKKDTVGKTQNVRACDKNFFLFKRLNAPTQVDGENHFTKLSDEIILLIFKWLPKKALVRCSMVNQTFKRVAYDESLWIRLDMGKRTIAPGFGRILFNGVMFLRLAQSTIQEPVFELSVLGNPLMQTKLQYLDLSMVNISKTELRLMLSKCRQLKKLSLENVPLSDEICREIGENSYIEALNLAMCEGISAVGVYHMVSKLKFLQSLNISWTNLSADSVKILVENITPDILRLNLAGCRKTITDNLLKTLVSRCHLLLELDLSDCTSLTSRAIDVVCQLSDLEYLSLSRCYNITASSYMDLDQLNSLAYLDIFGVLTPDVLDVLQKSFPKIGINKFHHSSVARPTVGTKRTSIWGRKTRD